jgi:lipopolysaccharide transport system permease protein
MGPADALGAHNLNPFASIWLHRRLVGRLAARTLAARWRGSLLGPLWTLATPLATLAIYGFAFGTVLRSRISTASGEDSAAPYALQLFCGLLFVHLFAESVHAVPGLIRANIVYVRQIVFPVEILPVVGVACALCGAMVSMVVLILAQLVIDGPPHMTALWLPVLAVPVALFALGAAWSLAAIGVHLRDLAQVVGLGCTAILLTSTVFYAIDAVPEGMRTLVRMNPATTIVDAARTALFDGSSPALLPLAIVTAVGLAFAWLGYVVFMRARAGFADVA